MHVICVPHHLCEVFERSSGIVEASHRYRSVYDPGVSAQVAILIDANYREFDVGGNIGAGDRWCCRGWLNKVYPSSQLLC